MSPIGTVHVAFAVVSLVAGTAVVFKRKGNRVHRTIGHFYFTSLVAVNITSLTMYRLNGAFNFFHGSAVLSLFFLIAGMTAVIRRRPKGSWMELHAFFVTGSYVGLLSAAAAETATRWLSVDFGFAIAAATLVVTVAGVAIMLKRIPLILKQFAK